MNRIVTLDEFIIRRQNDFDYATGELTGLLRDIGVAAKIVNREVNKAGLVNIFRHGWLSKFFGRHRPKTRPLCQRKAYRVLEK